MCGDDGAESGIEVACDNEVSFWVGAAGEDVIDVLVECGFCVGSGFVWKDVDVENVEVEVRGVYVGEDVLV